MRAKLPALEKNILKYRALEMVLLLHEVESFRAFLLSSIRATDSRPWRTGTPRLPIGASKPMKKALEILVAEGVISKKESEDLESIVGIRNKIGHAVHNLVQDISAPPDLRSSKHSYDYGALERFENYRQKIERGMMSKFLFELSFRGVVFDQAEATYKEELSRLRCRINRQYSERQKLNKRSDGQPAA